MFVIDQLPYLDILKALFLDKAFQLEHVTGELISELTKSLAAKLHSTSI